MSAFKINAQPSTPLYSIAKTLRLCTFALATLALYLPLAAKAYEELVTKEVFEIPLYNTVGGQVIRQVRVGFESYGHLNASGDNAILICHFLTGTSHAAGKYRSSDPQAGYWAVSYTHLTLPTILRV